MLKAGKFLSRAGVRVLSHPPLSATCLSKAAKVDFQLQCDMSTAVAADLSRPMLQRSAARNMLFEFDARPSDLTG